MNPPPSGDTQSLRLVLVIAVLLAVLHPLWVRLVNEAWDGLLGPRSVRVVDLPLVAVPPPPLSSGAMAEPVAPPIAAAESPLLHVPVTAEPAPVARAIGMPEVLGAGLGSGEPQLLVELRGHDERTLPLDEICVQAQRWADTPLSGRFVRVHAHEDDAPAREIGRYRCP